MEIKEFKQLKANLERDISISVSSLVEEFRQISGFSPDRINIVMIEVSEIGHPKPNYIVGQVSVDVDI